MKSFAIVLLGIWLFSYTSLAFADSLCARVKIEIRQELTLERQAFDAHMAINNGLTNITLENVNVDVKFTDKDGNSVLASSDPNNTNALFFIRIDSMNNINNVDGTGAVQPSTTADIHWLIIPAPGSSNGLEQGALYYVGATLKYTLGGEEHVTEVSPDYIFVKPMPEMTLDYFLPTDVYGDDPMTPEIEPVIPFNLGVRVKNNGQGTARNLKIDSAQPKIVDNEQGLLINFVITGSEVNGQAATNSLLVNFGDTKPNTSGTVRWIMTSSLSGKFVEFTATYSHADALGGAMTSLIDAVNTHFLVHDVLVDLAGRDSIKDFLAKDGDVYRVYESDSIDTAVYDQSASASLQFLSQTGSETVYTLAAPATAGFMYVQLSDPFGGGRIVKEVIRSDGKRIKLENAWFSKTRIKSNPWQYFFNLFDVNTTTSYTITFTDAAGGPQAPVLQFIPDRIGYEGQQVSFIVEASDPNGTIPTLKAAPLPAGAKFTDKGNLGNGIATGIFDWTPQAGQAGRYEITYTASDGVLSDSKRAVITIKVPGDTDGDGYQDSVETASGSDPENPDSVPEPTSLALVKGYNLVSFPAETKYYGTISNLMQTLGGSALIEKMLVFDQNSQTFIETGYDANAQFYGQNIDLSTGYRLDGMIIYAKQDVTIPFTSKYCYTWNLKAGINIVGSPCASQGLTAFGLLNNLGIANVSSIRRFNPETGKFETSGYFNGTPAGVDFPLTQGDGYFINMQQNVSGFRP